MSVVRQEEQEEVLCESRSVSWTTVELQSVSSSSGGVCPELLLPLSDVQVQSGDVAEFSCCFSGQPFTSVVWDHNGRHLLDSERVSSGERGGALLLVIQRVGVSDQGEYGCTASNLHGLKRCSAQLTLQGALSLLCHHLCLIWSTPPLLPAPQELILQL